MQHGPTNRLVLRRSWSRMETLSTATVTQESSTQNTGNAMRDRRFPNLCEIVERFSDIVGILLHGKDLQVAQLI
jgi:hypothetical protein